MGWKTIVMKVKKEGLRYLSISTVFILLFASYSVMFVGTVQAAPGPDTITSYEYEGSLEVETEFADNSSVIINVTVDNKKNDTDPWYHVKATNLVSGEWVYVPVSDNNSDGILNGVNFPGDGVYWGEFWINSSRDTSNAQGPGDPTILNVSDEDQINISEIEGDVFDGDADIAWTIITVNFSAEGPGPNNPPDTPNNEDPPNNSENRPLETDVSWEGDDPDGDTVTYDVYFGTTSPPPKKTSNQSAKTYDPGNLNSSETYYWKIISWDEYGAYTDGPIWSFTTEASGGDPPAPEFQDNITTYRQGQQGITSSNSFYNDSTVIVNLTVNDTAGDPDPWYYNIRARNINTSEYIDFNVSDNRSRSYTENIQNDSIYWGEFNLSSIDPTSNDTNSGPTLQVTTGDIINITEIPGGSLDGDQDIAYEEIRVVSSEGPSEPGFQDTITSYQQGQQGLTASDSFSAGDTIVVNVTVNDTSGDPSSGWYHNVKAINTETGEWIFVNVTDNDSHPGTMNTPNDGIYWGNFTINVSQPTDNNSRVLNVTENDRINITEISGGALDGDQDIAIKTITVGSQGGGSGTANISGYVINQDNMQGIPESTVYLYNNGTGDPPQETTTDGDGAYQFSNLEASTYNLQASKEGQGGFPPEWHPDGEFSVSEGESITEKNFEVQTEGDDGSGPQEPVSITISGYIYQNNTPEVPVENVNVTARNYDNPSQILGWNYTNRRGYYIIEFDTTESHIEVEIITSHENYTQCEPVQFPLGWVIEEMGGEMDMWPIMIDRIWETTNLVYGYVKNVDGGTALQGAIIVAEGPDYFWNTTQTDENGYFEINTIDDRPGYPFEFLFRYDGFFLNYTECAIDPIHNLGTIYLEEIPPYTAWINGTLSSNGAPIPHTELVLIDPSHPFEAEMADFPRTNATGVFNISTYPGTFNLVTLAKIIGKRKDGPPLAIGGYQNNIFNVTVAENESYNFDDEIGGITLDAASADPINISMTLTDWNQTTVNMSRTLIGNAKIVRTLMDSDKSGNLSFSELNTTINAVGNSLTQSDMFDDLLFYLDIPTGFSIDSSEFIFNTSNVEFQGLAVNSSIYRFNPFTIWINGTLIPTGLINSSAALHSATYESYYRNPAFQHNISITYPQGYTVRDIRPELIRSWGLNASTIIIQPNYDPDINDTLFYENVHMCIGTTDPFASLNSTYSYEDAIDSDGNGKYDFLMRKVKFSTSQTGKFKIIGTLRSSKGITIDTTVESKSYSSTGQKTYELYFDGETIYRKNINGPYVVVFDLFYYQNGSYIWFDSVNQTTNSYLYTEFDQPPIFFTGTLDDYGVDENGDGTYDYLIVSVEVDVGEKGYYEFEGDIGTMDFNFEGDPHIAHTNKNYNFIRRGIQLYNMSFDGSQIYSKGRNASIWINIRVRSQQYGHLDEINYMTSEKYYYTEFDLPPPQNSSVYGNVTDVFGSVIQSNVFLFDEETHSENSTSTNTSTGAYCINCTEGKFNLEARADSPDYENHWEFVPLAEEEDKLRNIKLLPPWDRCEWVDHRLDQWQYATGQNIWLNISCSQLPESPAYIEVYREYREGDEYMGEMYITNQTNQTDENGEALFIINTAGWVSGEYMIKIVVYNSTTQMVARGDVWGLQISALACSFEIDKDRYRPGATGTGTYHCTFTSNGSSVSNASYTWKILFWDWMGENVVSSGSFTNETGQGSFTFDIPDDIDANQWYDIRLTARYDNNEVRSWNGFGITTGSVIEAVSDTPTGTPGNYDYLTANVTVNVTSDGWYRINGGLHKENWDHLTGNETEVYLSEGTNYVLLNFEGEQIQEQGQGYSGVFKIWIGLYRSGEWYELDSLEHTTDTYNTDEFARPVAVFETAEGISYEVIGTVDDYEALLVNVSINASVSGNYSVHGNLHRKVEQSGGWIEWRFVAWNRTESIYIKDGGVNNTNTSINVTIRFEGTDIYNSGENGPWNVNFNLHKVLDNDWEEWITWYDPEDQTIPYNYDQFTKPAASIDGITDYGPVNGDLVIGVQVNVSSGQGGTYRIGGDLHNEEWWWITWDNNETTLTEGANEVNLTFSGEAIYSSGYNGPYKLHVHVDRVDPWEWLGGREFTTNAHNYDDFSLPGGVFEGNHSDSGFDEDGDGDYDYVRVTVPVNFTETGSYEISGDLYKEVGYRDWIAWGYEQIEVTSTGTQDVSIDFSGYEIMKKGYEGYYGISLWLRSASSELDSLEFTTDTYYYLDEFSQPAVRFTDDSPTSDELSPTGDYINVTVKINSSEVGTYKVQGDLHKVIEYPEWDDWRWITHAQKEVSINQAGEFEVVVSFDTAMISSAGYDGPYMIHFELMDSNWNRVDFIEDYQTSSYSVSSFSDIPANFTGEYDDYLSSDSEWVIVNATINVSDSGNYRISGDLHKQDGWMWNFIAGADYEGSFSEGEHIVQLYFDAVEILDNIESKNLNEFDSGSTFDIDLWLQRRGESNDLDQLSVTSINTYSTSDFSSMGGSIVTVSDNGYNETGDEKYEYLNITVDLNFTEAGSYEIWCDLSKESGFNWYWIGWKNEFITITSAQISDGYETVQKTLQFKGERISSEGYDSPYRLYMELQNLDTGKRLDRYEGETSGSYVSTDFVGSSVEFDESSTSAEGVNTDETDSEYNYLLVSVNVTASEAKNIVLTGDLHKQTDWQWQWIDWKENWTSLSVGTNRITLQFDGELIRNSGIDGPYQIRLELWDTDTWELLDIIDGFDTPAYSYDNFQAPAIEIVDDNITDWGNDTNNDGLYDYLDVNVSVNVASEGTYEIVGDLASDRNGWTWIGWANTIETLETGESTVTLHFSGMQIRNKEIDGPYKAHIEVRDTNGRMMDKKDQYNTQTYAYTDFQGSEADLVGASDRGVGTQGSYETLELNVTVNCSNAGETYWIGADLHKQSGHSWTFISWESTEFTSTGEEQIVPIEFSGEMIRNSETNGPYQVRIELRDTDTWTEQDLIERYNTNSYDYTDFQQPSVSFNDSNISDWGNDTDGDGQYNYLEVNVTVNCSQAGTYWIHADLEKQTGYNRQFITWKGMDVSLDGTGEQTVQLQFDGERISNSEINGPYHIHMELTNPTTWQRYDVIEQYTTSSYTASQFERATVEFIESDTSPDDRGIGTQGAFTYLDVNVTINSTTQGTYWLHADLFKQSAGFWEFISWQGQQITHNGTGRENFTILFDGNQIRNKQIDGPYQVHMELMNISGEWRIYDTIEQYTTNSYSYTDFASAGIELVEQNAGSADSITGGNLQVNVTVNSSVSGTYKIWGDLHKESGFNWQWISWNETQVSINDSGEQTFTLLFEGGDIYEKEIDGPYHVRIELRNIGTETMIDSIDRYTTSTYAYTDFSVPPAGLNSSVTSDYAPNYENLTVNVTGYASPAKEYQITGVLFGANWEFIDWTENVSTISGYDNMRRLVFDASIINSSGIDPEKCYVEMRRTSDWKLIDSFDYNLQGEYSASDFGAGADINESSITSTVHDSDGDGYNNTLNVTVNVTFTTAGNYEVIAGLKDQAGTKITGKKIAMTPYDADTYQLTLGFDGLSIYKKGSNGPYVVSFISVSQQGMGEIARVTDAHTTPAYSYTNFERPAASDANASLEGEYSSYVLNVSGDSCYEYLVINVSVNVTTGGVFDVYGDLYSSDGTTWISGDENNSVSLSQGVQTVQLYFEGSDIYASYTNGPYLLGYVRIAATIDDTWVILDEQSNAHTTASYNYSDFESNASEIDVLRASGVSSISVSNDPFSPNADGVKDTTIITVTATAGQTLYANIYNSTNVIKRTGLALSGSSTTYTATWNGKDDSNTVVADGTYRIKVSDESSGDASSEAEETQTVVVDTATATGVTITINNDDQYTNTTSVTLTLAATDNSSKKMRFKNAGGNWTDWEDFLSSRSWNLTSTDGVKTVSFQVNDSAGNIGSIENDSITLDSTKPSSVNITITGKGDKPSTHSNDVSVTLSIDAEDATSGVEYMIISNTVAFTDRSWEEYNESKEWSLNSGYGVKTVYIKVKDRAGKISNIYSDNITLDTTDPANLTISINSDQQYTNSTNVTLTISATDNNEVKKMSFSNNASTWSTWESYTTEKNNWPLSSGDGNKKVYFRVKDTAGNIATHVNDTITLDTNAPSLSNVNSSGISQTSATITWTTNEASTTYVEYGTTTSYGSNTTINTTKVTSHSQLITGLTSGTTYHYRVESRDTAGNTRTGTDKTFTTTSGSDTTPPDAISGVSTVDKSNAEKTITISWTQSNAPDFAAYKIYRKTASFTNVTASGVQLIKTISDITTTSYDDTNATDDTNYYYAVTAIDTATPPNENQSVTSTLGLSWDDKPPSTTDNIPVGWQTEETVVTLTATDNGKGVNVTRYTTEGSDPTNFSNGHNYTVPFTLSDGKWTIKYYSYDKNSTQNNESIHTKTLKIDTLPPITTDNVPAGWQNSTVTVSLSSSDDTSNTAAVNTSGVNKIYYTKDGSTPTIASSQYNSSLGIIFTSNGNRTLKYFARDNASNAESIRTSYILIDTVKPTSSVTQPSSAYSSSPVTVSWTSSDATSGICNVTIQVKNGTGSWTEWLTNQNSTGSASYTGYSGSTYYFRSIALDNASNYETDYSSSGDVSTTISGDRPTATITSPSNDTYHRQNVTFIGTANDSSFDLTKWWLNHSSDGSTWTNIANATTMVNASTLGTLNTSTLSDGTYSIQLYVKNQINLENWANITLHFDNTAPILSAISSSVTSNSATITWTTDEAANSTVQYSTDASDLSSTSTSATYTTSHSETLTSLDASTKYYYQVISYDRAGNENTSKTRDFTTSADPSDSPGSSPGGPSSSTDDSTDEAPLISNVYNEPEIITSNDYVNIYATVTDDYNLTSVDLFWNDGTSHSKSMILENDDIYNAEIGPFSDGTRVTYYIKATDNASQTTESEEHSFTIEDQTSPEITIKTPLDGTTTDDRTPPIKASYTDTAGIDVSTINLKVDGSDKTSSSTITESNIEYIPTVPMEYGIHEVVLTVSDIHNNAASKTWTFTIEELITSATEVLDNISANESKSVSFEDTDTGIDTIDVKASKEMNNVEVHVEKYKEKPDDVDEPEDKTVYSYLNIETNAEEGDIESLLIKFKVEQTWIEENNVDKEDIILMRHHNGQWEELETIILDEDVLYVYLQAEAPGTSTFAVTGRMPTEQDTQPFDITYAIIAAVLTVIIIVGLLYYRRRTVY